MMGEVVKRCTGICKECLVNMICKVVIKEERDGEGGEQ